MNIEPHKAMPLALAQAAKLRTAICLLESGFEEDIDLDDLSISASTLETLHARVQELEDHIAQARKMVSAPVLPEPFALYDGEKWYANEEAAICSCATMQQLNIQKLQKVFTEQQVRALLAAGGQAQEHATQLADQGQDDLRTAALQDSAYAAGMLSGWNFCIADDNETFSKVRGERMMGAVRALKEARAAAPAQPQADTRDAERYRWLRDEWLGNEPEAINMERAKGQRGLDAAIDAAIAAAKENT